MRTLRGCGLEPQDSWVSVLLAHAPPPRDRTYTVVIAYQPARVAVAELLHRTTSSAEKQAVRMLDEAEARQLCEGV